MVHKSKVGMVSWFCQSTTVGKASTAAATLAGRNAGVMMAEPNQIAPAVLLDATAERAHVSLGATDWLWAAKARAWACVCLHSIVPSSSYSLRLA
jgi:hypothetical protein